MPRPRVLIIVQRRWYRTLRAGSSRGQPRCLASGLGYNSRMRLFTIVFVALRGWPALAARSRHSAPRAVMNPAVFVVARFVQTAGCSGLGQTGPPERRASRGCDHGPEGALATSLHDQSH